jgi:dGTPase
VVGVIDFGKMISKERRRSSKVTEKRDLLEEMASDRSRIVYSAPFRRLSQKAQVFSLQSNPAIRTRITHSLEVSDVGRLIAYGLAKKLIRQRKMDEGLQLPMLYAVENICLLHDIGNPPFGHLGETAIKNWFGEFFTHSTSFLNGPGVDTDRFKEDFLEFDGNPQGLRIILRLRRDRDAYGLNLTYTAILGFIKYVRGPREAAGSGLRKKLGYFETERKIVSGLKRKLGIPEYARHPLTYIMEAADDIAYCMSDIEDGIEKNILSAGEFLEEVVHEWRGMNGESHVFPLLEDKRKRALEQHKERCAKLSLSERADLDQEEFFEFKSSYAREAINVAIKAFITNADRISDGSLPSLFEENTDAGRALQCLKNVARRKLFRSQEAENPELAGYKIITGLLDGFQPLLECSKENFDLLREAKSKPSVLKEKRLDLEWRLFNKLPRKHLQAYEDQLEEFDSKIYPEWYLRAHLLVDFISGMTDRFALQTYQLLNGIRLQ